MTLLKVCNRALAHAMQAIPALGFGAPLKPGSVISCEKSVSRLWGELKAGPVSDTVAAPEMRFTSGAGVVAKLSGDVGANEIDISFGDPESVFLELGQARWLRLDNLLVAREKMLKRKANKDWNPNWAVVTEVLEAKSAFLVVSQKKKAGIKLRVPPQPAGELISLTVQARADFVKSADGVTHQKYGDGKRWFPVAYRAIQPAAWWQFRTTTRQARAGRASKLNAALLAE